MDGYNTVTKISISSLTTIVCVLTKPWGIETMITKTRTTFVALGVLFRAKQ